MALRKDILHNQIQSLFSSQMQHQAAHSNNCVHIIHSIFAFCKLYVLLLFVSAQLSVFAVHVLSNWLRFKDFLSC